MVTVPAKGRYRAPVETMDLTGGELCLDLVNTASERTGAAPMKERLWEYGDLLGWGVLTESLTEAEAASLAAAAGARPAAAAVVLERARVLRDTMYRVFHAVQEGTAPDGEDIARLSTAGSEATAAQRLVVGTDGFEMEWPETDVLDRAWWPAATSAVALLLSGDLERVKECATDHCNWMFIDRSRNRSRRWCDMKDCGNRAKARRHYARRKRA